MANLNEFIAYLEGEVQKRSIYVWGAQGETGSQITEAWIRKRETSTKNADRAIAYWKKSIADGHGNELSAFDCSGLGMYWICNLKKLTSGDMSSNSMYSKCKKITKAELKKGDWVFRHSGIKVYHIGYIVDDDLNVIECMGRDVGCVKRPLNASGDKYWNKFGRPDWVFESLKTNTATTSTPIVPVVSNKPYNAICSGTKVNVRSGRGTTHAAITQLVKGDCMLALPAKDGWCEIAYVSNKGLFATGYMSEKYVKKV